MKTTSSFAFESQLTAFLYKFSVIDKGIGATENMNIPKPDGLKNYFNTVGKGKYFSISKRAAIKKDPQAKEGLQKLQDILRSSGVFDKTVVALNNKDSAFRKSLEANTVNRDNGSSVSLFRKSLQYFDRRKKLYTASDGDYGHSVRLAVAYLQHVSGAKVDGAFGEQMINTLSLGTPDQWKSFISTNTKTSLATLKQTLNKKKEVVAVTPENIELNETYRLKMPPSAVAPGFPMAANQDFSSDIPVKGAEFFQTGAELKVVMLNNIYAKVQPKGSDKFYAIDKKLFLNSELLD